QLSQLIADLRHQKKLSNATINRVRALLSSIFNMAIDHELIETNPVLRVKKYKENNQKERYLNDDELKKLMHVLSQPTRFGISNLVIVAVIKFLLLTGVRNREALDMLWTDVDLKTGVWLLSENKSGKARRIHLNQDALSIIHQ
ncbi:tyrosine-type recombinase/integrase, partial [Acinetobacter baumannii]|uniref:tyrosine-type recombinase/integrase n=1 Tax=Acinetobacter baumannii TaxID=470 RepID=UPI0024B839A7